jgi:hypothetical protein
MIHAIEFDELRQRSYWPASDRHGRFVALEAPTDRRPDGELDGRLTGRSDPLVVEATVEDGAIRLLPLSLLGATITTLDFIDFEQSGRRIGMVERAKGLLVRRKTRIRRFSLSPPSRAGRRAPADSKLEPPAIPARVWMPSLLQGDFLGDYSARRLYRSCIGPLIVA